MAESWDEGKERSLVARQVIVDQPAIDNALRDCQVFSGNDVISCYPTSGVHVPQHDWATFVWNSRRPELTQINLVDIYLFRGDSRREVLSFKNQPNPQNQAGWIRAQVDDRWFGEDGLEWSGGNKSYPFYWVIIRSDKTLDGNEIPQSIFTAVQTTVADSVAASSSSAAAASSSSAASASAASLSSLSALSSSVVTTINGTPTTYWTNPSGNVQPFNNGNDPFPRWAIAVIVVLGFFAIAATCILIFFIIRRIRRRNQAEVESNRNSVNSASPMMANVQQDSPLLGPTILPPMQQRPASLRRNDSHGGPSVHQSDVLHDGASGISGEGGPFSGADAAIMADAFRKMLRKPDFAAIGEGDSPESQAEAGATATGQEVMNRELAEEGRDLRSVASSRGITVESHSHHGEDPHQR